MKVNIICLLKTYGLSNGCMGFVKDIISHDSQSNPPSLLLAVVVEFGDYTELKLFSSYTKSMSIVPITSQTYVVGDDMSLGLTINNEQCMGRP